MFDVKWTGSWPCLCSGEWVILKNGMNVSASIPEDLRNNEMGTAGTYSSWHFESDWSEVWEDYEDGMEEAEWIAANPWIASICDNDAEKSELFHAIQCEDWRHGSCGGCI